MQCLPACSRVARLFCFILCHTTHVSTSPCGFPPAWIILLHPSPLTVMPTPMPLYAREVVAQGGPNPEDHPDLFRLFDKQLNSSKTAGSKAKDSGAAAALPSPAGGSSAGQCGTTVAKVKNKKQQKGDNHPGGNAVGVVAEEEGGACPLQRGEEQEEQASSAGEVGETTERVQTVEKCPW